MKRPRDIDSLIIEHLDYLYHLAYRLTGCPHSAEDLVQEVFVNLTPKEIDISYVRNPKAWLATVLYRTFVRHWRSEKRSPISKHNKNNVDEPNWTEEELPSSDMGPAELTDANKLQKHLLNALYELNIEYRAVVVMHDVEGYTLQEIQQITDTPIGTLKSRLHRARNKLQKILKNMKPFEEFTPSINKRLKNEL